MELTRSTQQHLKEVRNTDRPVDKDG